MSTPPAEQPEPRHDSSKTTPHPAPPRSTVPETAGETLAGDPALLPPAGPPKSAKLPEAPQRPLPSLPGFEVLKELGRGGMGVVYLVRHCKMNRTEALKMILSGDHASSTDLERFQTEARTVASLRHNNFVQIYDVGEAGGHPYLRLEFIGGGNLEDWLDRQLGVSCLDPKTAARQVEHLARAMHHMHEKGLIHRDLKPANVLISLPDEAEGRPVKLEECDLKISDFGLAREVRGPGAHTRGIIGTPAYMAPEQAMGGHVDRRVDVYALGAILYRLLTGRAPHDGDDPMSVLARLIQPGHEPVPPSQLRPEVPAELDAICRKSLEKDPKRRHASAKELADDLEHFVETGKAASRSPSRPASAPETMLAPPGTVPASLGSGVSRALRRPRNPGVLAAFALIVVLVLGLAYFGYSRWSRANQANRAEALAVETREKQENEASTAMAEAKLAREKGDKKGALQNYWKAQELLEKMREQYPDQSKLALALAKAHIDEGSLWVEYQDAKEAESDFTFAIDVLTKQIPAESAGDDVGLALADAYHHRGELKDTLMQWRAALGLYQDALKIRDGLWWKNKSDRAFRRDVARSYSSIGSAQLQLGHIDKAHESYDEAEKIRRKLVEEDATDDDARYQLARSQVNKGNYHLWRGDLNPSIKQFDEARHIYENLTSRPSANVRHKAELADIYLMLGELHLDQDKRDDVPELVQKARAIYDELASNDSDEATSRSGRIRCAVVQARLIALTDPAEGGNEASKLFEQIREYKRYLNIEKRQSTAEDSYNSAVTRALHNDREMALSSLKSAVNSYGFRNFARARLDVAFRPLFAKDAEFKKAIDRLEKTSRKGDDAAAEETE